VHYDPTLYESSVPDLVDLVRRTGPGFGTVLLIGHNPMVSLLSAALDPSGVRDSDGLRTSGLAVHTVPGEWADLRMGSAPLAASHTARA
jgi:phosphohistidine phosphatase